MPCSRNAASRVAFATTSKIICFHLLTDYKEVWSNNHIETNIERLEMKTAKVTVYNAWTGLELWTKFFCGEDAEERAEAYADNHWNDDIRACVHLLCCI